MLKKLFLTMILLVGTHSILQGFSLPAAVPIHTMSIANVASLIGVIRTKSQTYERLRTLLLEQLKKEARQPSKSDFRTSDAITRVRNASHRELAHIIGDIIQRRRMYEEEFSDILLAEKMGFEKNKEEKELVDQYDRLLARALKYEWWVPQLRTALIGTSAASIFTALRQFGVLD